MTARQLQATETRYRRAVERAEAALQARDAAVRKALAEGWTQKGVADALELTKQRIHQIKTRPMVTVPDSARYDMKTLPGGLRYLDDSEDG